MAEYGTEWTASVRANIKDQIKAIQPPKAGKNLKDVAIPNSVYKLANSISKTSEARDKFSKVPVYYILLEDLQRREHVTLDKANTVLDRWKIACNSLFRYALNLILAPTRADFKKMKLSSSFYVYNISHNLHHAERVLIHMGYRPADKKERKERKESQDLVYDGDVKTELVLETATDLLVMHEEIVRLQENVSVLIRGGRSNCMLQQVFNQNKLDVPRDPHWTPPTGSPRSASSHFLPPPPVPFTGETAADHEHVYQHVLGASAGGQYTVYVNAGEMQMGGNSQKAATTTAPPSCAPPTSHGYVNLSFEHFITAAAEQVVNQNKLDVPRSPHWSPPTGSSRSASRHPPIINETTIADQVKKYKESKGVPIATAVREAGLLITDLEETEMTLGTGSYGEVVQVQVRGKRCAAKKLHGIFSAHDVPAKEKTAMAERFKTECRRVLYIKHTNIIEMIGIHFDPVTGYPTLVMELMDTSLRKYLETHPETSVPLCTKYSILYDVANGLLYLHTLPPPLGPMVHRDLTANNILLALGRGVVAKIADLGQAKIDSVYATRQQSLSKIPGNDDHMPPEAWMDNPVYGASLDIFSFAVVTLHTLTHEWPKPLARLKSYDAVRDEVERRKPYLDKIAGNPLVPIVNRCLTQCPDDRPSTSEVFYRLATCLSSVHEQIHNAPLPSSQAPPTSQGYINLNIGSATPGPSVVAASEWQAIPGNTDRFPIRAVQPTVGGSNSDMYVNLPRQQYNLQPAAGPIRQLSYQEGPVGATENNQVVRRTSSPNIAAAPNYPTTSSSEVFYVNLNSADVPAGPVRQFSYQEGPVGATDSYQGVRRTSSPNVAATSNYPPTSSTATGWDGPPASNAPIYQNFPNTSNYPGNPVGPVSSSEPPYPSTYRDSHPAQTLPVHNTPIARPVPKSRTRRPTSSSEAQQVVVEGFQEQNVHEAGFKAQQAVSGEASGPEQENVYATYLKGQLQRRPPSKDSIAENLPPPITDFTSPSTGDTYFESGIRSGLLSEFPRGIDSGDSLRLNDPDSSSGPIGLSERTVSDSNSSGYSTDIYGSGPGFVRQQSSVPLLEALDEEELVRGGGERQEEGDNDLKMSMDSRPQHASSCNITTEGRRRLFEHFDSTGHQNSLLKSMSMDEGENSNPREERSSPQSRSTKSGTNLGEFEKQQQQQSENEKPPLSPRISRLAPSSPSARQFSPTASPRSGHRNRPLVHENWVPTKGVAGVTLVPLAEETTKSNTRPRQAKSVDVDPLPKREVSRFSSGSNLLQNSDSVPSNKHLDLREPQQPQSRENYEPVTAVVGIIPSHLQKKFGLGEQVAPGLQLQQQHTETSDKQNEARVWGKEQQQEHPASSMKQPNFPREPVGFSETQELLDDMHPVQWLKPQYAPQTYGKDELKQKLEQAHQQQISIQKQLKEKDENEKKLQQQLEQEKQEKDEIQKKLRDLELMLQQQKQERKHAPIPMLTASKSVAIVSNAKGKPTSSRDEDESRLDYAGGGGGARALKEVANQRYPGEEPQRNRAYNSSGKPRPKRSSEQETGFHTPSPDYHDNNNTLSSIPDDTRAIDIYLENTWVCEYCTNLNSDFLTKCEVCNRPDPRKCWTCGSCKKINPTTLPNCLKCKKMRVTTV